MRDDTTPAICGNRCDTRPETVCTEPPRHRLPHGGPLITDGRHCGGAAWGPDHGYADEPTGRTETGPTIANTQATDAAREDTAGDNEVGPDNPVAAQAIKTLMRGERRQRTRAEEAEAALDRALDAAAAINGMRAKAEQCAEQAEAAIARVRSLHQRSDQRRPLDLSLTPITHCGHCGQDWPCATVRTLDEQEGTL